MSLLLYLGTLNNEIIKFVIKNEAIYDWPFTEQFEFPSTQAVIAPSVSLKLNPWSASCSVAPQCNIGASNCSNVIMYDHIWGIFKFFLGLRYIVNLDKV